MTKRCPETLAVVLSALTLGAAVVPVAAQQRAVGPTGRGEELFETRCVACHSLGTDRLVGPGLQGVTERRDPAWLRAFIAAPDRMLAAGDSLARQLLATYQVQMPNLGLSAADADSIVAFLSGPAAQSRAAGAAPPPGPPGDPLVGKSLFTGAVRFRNGGPPCMGCHSIAGIAALGGGALGPDLTPASEKFGAGLAFVLASIPFPTMSPIFWRRPLTAEEQAHLVAFFKQASVSGRSPRTVGLLTGMAVAATLVLFGLAHLSWRGRLGSVRRSMVERERTAHDPKRVSNR